MKKKKKKKPSLVPKVSLHSSKRTGSVESTTKTIAWHSE